MSETTSEDSTQNVFVALADPTRRLLLEKLSADGRKTATELAKELPITRQGVSKHLKILVKAELVHVHQDGRERYYNFVPQPLDEAVSWVKTVNQQWDDRLRALQQYLNAEQDQDDTQNT